MHRQRTKGIANHMQLQSAGLQPVLKYSARGHCRQSLPFYFASRRYRPSVSGFQFILVFSVLPVRSSLGRRSRWRHPCRVSYRRNINEDGVLLNVASRTGRSEPVDARVSTRDVVDAQPEVEPRCIVPAFVVVCRHCMPVTMGVCWGRLGYVNCVQQIAYDKRRIQYYCCYYYISDPSKLN